MPPETNFTTFHAPDLVAPHTAAPVPVTEESTYASQKVSTQDEQALLEKIHKDHDSSTGNPYGHLKTIMPLGAAPPPVDPVSQPYPPANTSVTADFPQAPMPPPVNPTAPVTPPVDPAIISLANNDDLNVATLARQANKANEQRPSDDEVVISLR